MAAVLISSTTLAADKANNYPILAIPRSAGADALLKYELTARERELFEEIDARTSHLPRSATPAEYHAVAVEIGSQHGLSPEQSIAFFVRTTFNEFEAQR